MAMPLWMALLALAAPPAAPLEEIAAAAGGVVGFAAVDLSTGRSLGWHDRDAFPMQSVVKLPIAIEVLREIDDRKLDLTRVIALGPADARSGPDGTMTVPASKTVRELLEAMIVSSDNVACDKLLALVGGPPSVTTRLRALGIADVTIRHSEAELAAGAADNTATPAALVTLLATIARRQAGLSPASTALLEDLLARVTTGPRRIRGQLPPGTPVGHKTGTSGTRDGRTDATNDVGLITLPNHHRVAVAIFLHASPADLATRERTIARLARAAYDAFNTPAPPVDAFSAARHYRVARREMELVIFSRTEGSLHIKDHLAAPQDGTGVIRLDYVLRPAAPLFRVVVTGSGLGGFGTGSATKPDDLARALAFFAGGGTLHDVWRAPGPYVLGERSETSSYPSGVAVVAREAGGDTAIEVMGRWPVINLMYDVGVIGRAMTEKSPPGVAPPKYRSFTRFRIPGPDPAAGTVSSLRVTIGAKTESRTGKRVITDSRRYWHAEITQLGAGQAVDLFPIDDDDRLSAAISNSHVRVADGGSSAQRRVQANQLSFVLPPPKVEFIRVVTAVVDVPPDRAELAGRALRALDGPVESAVVPVVVGAAPDQVFRSPPAMLTLPSARALPEALLGRALAASNKEHPMVVFTDRPAEIARAAAHLTFKHPLHVVHVTGPAPRGWSRVLGRQRAEARIVERTGGIWIEMADAGAALESLWEHLVSPRFLDDIELTLNGAPFRPEGYLAAAFETPGQPWRNVPPASVALGSDLLAMLISVGPSPGTSKHERWEVSGLVWNRRIRFGTDAAPPGHVAIRNLRLSPALEALPAPYRSALEAHLSQLHDVLPGIPQAYVSP